jgi:protein-S-isoprenylcysteine O-methyltransferase Ste14
MNKLSPLGIGPKIAVFLLPWLAASIVLSCWDIELFKYVSGASGMLVFAGIFLLITGLLFYFSSARLLLRGLEETKLVTKGPYGLCRNPLYASLMLFVIPGLSLMLNSWLVLTSSIVGFIPYKIFIGQETMELEKFFSDDYLRYKRETPEFFPLPLKKWMRKNG